MSIAGAAGPLRPGRPGKGRMLGAAGFTPAGWRRKERGRRRKPPEAAELAARRALMAERRAAMEAEQAGPAGGGVPAAHRASRGRSRCASWRRLKIEPHRATSEVLSVAYPFLAEAGLGSEGVLIGHDSWSGAAFCLRPVEPLRAGRGDQPERCCSPG